MDFFAVSGISASIACFFNERTQQTRGHVGSKGTFLMSLQLRTTLLTIVLMSLVHISGARTQERILTNEQSQIVETVNTIFNAIQTDDAVKLNLVISPEFYIFDGGKRFNAEQVMAIFKAQHLAGKRYEWNVTEPDIHISGNTAWIAYVNDGSISDASGRARQQWLESGFLEKQAGTWKVVFMQSTRVPTMK
jgi:ketosteroid isomerase-like protein